HPPRSENSGARRLPRRAPGGRAAAGAPPRGPPRASAARPRLLVEAVLDLHPDVGRAMVRAFARGYLDVPYCLHADNRGRARSYIDSGGRLRWASIGSMPIGAVAGGGTRRDVTSSELLDALSHVERAYDRLPAGTGPDRPAVG
ncbi:methylaspartate mutase, partial [Streptomyces sp. NPDC059506]